MAALALAALAPTPALAGPAPAALQAPITLAAYRGKVVYLDFWASWCGPCKQSFPYMAGLSHQFQGRDFVVVTVNLDRSRAMADQFLAAMNGQRLPVIFDTTGALARHYRVSDMPTAVLIDRTGRLRFTHKGFHPDQQRQYQAHIDQLLAEI